MGGWCWNMKQEIWVVRIIGLPDCRELIGLFRRKTHFIWNRFLEKKYFLSWGSGLISVPLARLKGQIQHFQSVWTAARLSRCGVPFHELLLIVWCFRKNSTTLESSSNVQNQVCFHLWLMCMVDAQFFSFSKMELSSFGYVKLLNGCVWKELILLFVLQNPRTSKISKISRV